MGSRLPCTVSALAAAGIVGQWEIDAGAGTGTLDRTAAKFIFDDETMAGIAVSMDQAFAMIHEEDRQAAVDYCRQRMKEGGPSVSEYRVVLPRGGVRRIQARGFFSWDDDRRMVGRGVFIDVTGDEATFASGPLPAVEMPRQAPPPPLDPLAEAAERSIEVRTALGRSGHGALRLAADLLLWEINTAIAARHTVSDKVVPVGLKRLR